MKKFFFYAAALFMTAVGFTACTAEDEVFPEPVLSIAEDETTISAEGGKITFNLTAPTNERFTIETPDWIEIDEAATTRGVNTVSDFTFIVHPAVSCQERVGAIKFTTVSGRVESINVVQAGVEPAFATEKEMVVSLGREISIALRAVDGYTITMPEWITLKDDITTTHKNQQIALLHFEVAKNTGDKRSGEIVVTCGDGCGKSATLVVEQLSQSIQYQGQLTSLLYDDVYDSNITIMWDDEDPTKVYVCDLEPYYASEGRNSANGENILPAKYSAADNMILIKFGTYYNIDQLFYASSDASTGSDNFIEYGLLLFSGDMSTVTLPFAFCTGAVSKDGWGYEDFYGGNVTYTLVTE